jgi:hypothetical protein
MQKWLSIYDNFNMLVINFMSRFYFPDPELHPLPVHPSAQITTRIIQISNTTNTNGVKNLKNTSHLLKVRGKFLRILVTNVLTSRLGVDH